MRIPCPFCGDRDHAEFVYHGASVGPRPLNADDMHAHVYQRANPAGANAELWYHAFGCRRWLGVVRDTRSHAIASARMTGAVTP